MAQRLRWSMFVVLIASVACSGCATTSIPAAGLQTAALPDALLRQPALPVVDVTAGRADAPQAVPRGRRPAKFRRYADSAGQPSRPAAPPTRQQEVQSIPAPLVTESDVPPLIEVSSPAEQPIATEPEETNATVSLAFYEDRQPSAPAGDVILATAAKATGTISFALHEDRQPLRPVQDVTLATTARATGTVSFVLHEGRQRAKSLAEVVRKPAAKATGRVSFVSRGDRDQLQPAAVFDREAEAALALFSFGDASASD